MAPAPRRPRTRGAIDQLPSGAYRVRIYAGTDPLTGKRHDLIEVVPPGPKAAVEAEKVRTRLLSQLDERRNPRTKATVNQLLDRYLEVVDLDESTRSTYVGYLDRHVRPVLGNLLLSKVDGEMLDTLYGQLRRCRARCSGRNRAIDHRTTVKHECDERCHPHVCRPMASGSVRQIHWILSGAMERAVRWRWIAISPVGAAQPPGAPKSNPSPPSAEEAARLLREAWKDPSWGAFVWVAMTTGARRGELCALRRRHLDLDAAALTIEAGVSGNRQGMREKDTKTHQKRRIAVDDDTLDVLRAHLERQDEDAARLGVKLGGDAYLFSLDPDCALPLVPDSVSQRFRKQAHRLGIKSSLHKLRHYNATELLAAGVDLRTVAGRLGHGGGGTTTLKVYAAWVSEADKRAAGAIASRLPRPG
jgi:integrase